MVSTSTIREKMELYVQLVNQRDIDAILALYDDNATVEDPVGSEPLAGIEAITRFYREGLGQSEASAEGEILIDYGPVGLFKDRDSFVGLFQEMACHDHVIDLHHGANPEITVNSDRATARWALYYFNINGHTGASRQLGGFYQDDYWRIDGQWKIVKTIFQAHSLSE